VLVSAVVLVAAPLHGQQTGGSATSTASQETARGSRQPVGAVEQPRSFSVVSVEAGLDEVRHDTARALTPEPSKGLHAPLHAW
jgi:hypothetical protein